MTRLTAPIPLQLAQERLLAAASAAGTETLPADLAAGRILAIPIQAQRTQPSADLSAMDGYAVREGESGPWRIVGESAAGHPYPSAIQPGEAIRISTGALMPLGADAVLLQENAEREGESLTRTNEFPPSARHIRRAGFDFAKGDQLLDPGTRLGPAQLALLIAGGNSAVDVYRRPTLAIIDSGDELSSDPENCAQHQIPASNGAMIAAMAAPLCSSTRRLGPVPDSLDSLIEALAGTGDADVIVTSGGASVGDHDLVRPALERWGAKIDFWRVAMKPGKPLLVATKGKQTILGLPGNPVSSFVTAHLFLLPLLRKLGGLAQCVSVPLWAPLAGNLAAGGNRLEFVRAIYRDGEVIPLQQQDSSAMRALAAANALIERPIDCPESAQGDRVAVHLLEYGCFL